MWGLPRLSVSKDTKVFAVAYEISHARADLKWARSARARAEYTTKLIDYRIAKVIEYSITLAIPPVIA